MHPISQMLIQQATSIDGYSPEQLLDDLLQTRLKLVNYQEAAAEYGLSRNTIAVWVNRGVLKRYGTGGAGARVNLYELAQLQLKPQSEPGLYARKKRTCLNPSKS